MHRRITGRLVIATHNPGKLAEMRELLAPYGIEAVSAGELGLGEPEETGTTFRANAADQGDAAAKAAQASGLRRRFRPGGRRAGRRSPASIRRAGPARPRISPRAMTRIERLLQERGATTPDAARRAFRLGAVRRLAGRPSRGGRGARRRHAGLAAARHRRLRLRSGVPARRPDAHVRRDDGDREARPAAARPRPVASRPRLREAGGDVP